MESGTSVSSGSLSTSEDCLGAVDKGEKTISVGDVREGNGKGTETWWVETWDGLKKGNWVGCGKEKLLKLWTNDDIKFVIILSVANLSSSSSFFSHCLCASSSFSWNSACFSNK